MCMCSRDGTGIWIQPGEYSYLLLNTPLLKGYGIWSAVVLASIKDNIGSFEASHMLKLLKILWLWKI